MQKGCKRIRALCELEDLGSEVKVTPISVINGITRLFSWRFRSLEEEMYMASEDRGKRLNPEMLREVHLTRRSLLKKSAALGLAVPEVATLLAACDPDDDDVVEDVGGASATGQEHDWTTGPTPVEDFEPDRWHDVNEVLHW
jgi:hypothetical protein